MARTAELVRTATCRVTRGMREDSGESLPERMVSERVRWLAALVAEVGQTAIGAHWDPGSVSSITADKGPDGRPLPTKGFTAFARLWGPARLPEGVMGPSRVASMGAELAARLLRATSYRASAVTTLLSGGLPEHCQDPVTGRNYRRKLGRMLDRTGELPTDLFGLEPQPPRVPDLVPLDVTDHQFFTARAAKTADRAHQAIDTELAARSARERERRRLRTQGETPPPEPRSRRDAGAVLLVRLKLPLRNRPAGPAEWAWHRLVINVPPRYRLGRFSPPTLRITPTGLIRADVTVTFPAPAPLLTHGELPTRVLGIDWGVRRLLSATVITALHHADGRQEATTDGRPLYFQAGRLQAKSRRIGAQRAEVKAKTGRYEQLLSGRHSSALRAKATVLHAEAERLGAKQTHINNSIARLAARWAVEQALAHGCQAIAVENLKSLESRGMGRRTNERVALAVRGRTTAAIREAAQLAGLAVIEVSASGTSTHCPRCDRKLVHRAAPDGGDGRAWALCRHCGHSADRDHAAAEKVGQRALRTTHVRVRHRRTTRGTAAAASSGEAVSGPGAGRPVTSPLAPVPRGAGHRSAGTGPRHEHHQAGRQRMTLCTGRPTRLDRILHAHRTTLRATGHRQVPSGQARGGTARRRPNHPQKVKQRFEPGKARHPQLLQHRPRPTHSWKPWSARETMEPPDPPSAPPCP